MLAIRISFLMMSVFCSAVMAFCQDTTTLENAKDSPSAAETILAEKGVEGSLEGIRKYLNDIHITPQQREEASKLIQKLGSDNYQQRRTATKMLSRFPGLPIEEFETVRQTADLELSSRIEMVSRFLSSSFGKTLSAAYRVVVEKEILGLMPELIRSAPFAHSDDSLRNDLLAAVVTTATPADDQQLRSLLKNESVEMQTAAIDGLYRSQKGSVMSLLVEITRDANRDDRVRFKAAESLADLGSRDSLAPLVQMLESADVNVRTAAGNTLQIATGLDHGFTGYSKDESRKAGVAKWEQWLINNGSSAKLRFPLEKFNDSDSYLNGNTLLACGYANRVIELSPDGKEVWSVSAAGAWSAERLQNGDTLVACYNQNRICQFNPAGKEVWTYPCKSPLNVRPLKNGNVLISEYSGRRVIEVNRKKEIVWSFAADASVADAVRMQSGNTLVAAQSKVVEIDTSGKIVWEYPVAQPYGIQALKNGNVLISRFSPGQVIEVSRQKKIVWQYDCKNPTDAMQLPNGNVLITENNIFKEVTREKEIVWTKKGASCGAARR